ncbi:MAG TPA: hypothetical protein VM686_17135 [Polyangiaceae bacterium]|nr:hypothetical protein [Polyangiaceae bacterium]
MRCFVVFLFCSLAVPATALAQSTPEERAREIYAQGKAAYAEGRYAEALADFEHAYALSGAPALLFDMAQAQRLAGPHQCRQALALYRSYLAAVPKADNRREVEEWIDEMLRCANAERAAQQPPAETPRPAKAPPASEGPAPEAQPSKVGPIMLTGFGAAVTVAGAVLYGAARHKYSEASERCPCYPGTYSSWETATTVSYALMAVGGVTVASGVTWWVSLSPEAGDARSGFVGLRGQF